MRRTPPAALISLLVAVPSAASAKAQEQPPICTDRPAKANATCTVPDNSWQLESTLASWSLAKVDGTRTDTWQVGGSVVKFGLSDRSDLQVAIVPYVGLRSRMGGSVDRVSGIGDVTVRYKRRLTGESAQVQVALIPFVKLPTAKRGIGNRKVEGGLALPIGISTGTAITVTLGPELDLIADSDGDGHHPQLVNLVNLSAPIAPRLTIAGEVWTATNFDPAGSMTSASADAALAYAVSRTLQVDIGANLGLTRNSPRAEVYGGASIRF